MSLRELWQAVLDLLNEPRVMAVARVVVIVATGFLAAKLLSNGAGRLFGRRFSAQQAMLARRATYLAMVALVLVSSLRELGFDLTVLLGAAGILTVAIGFASQTSASNLISGLFLIAERPFVVGDTIMVGDTMGDVLSIDLLSVKLRTLDNTFVRLPNELMVKSQITNLSYFPIRRLDLKLGVAYKEDMARVHEVLLEVADRNPQCLEEPAPLFIFLGFGESSLDLQFSVWVKRENLLELRNRLQREIKEAFDARGIEIPFPQRVVQVLPAPPEAPAGEVRPQL